MKKRGLLSLVVPAYRQENTIVNDIKSLRKVLSALPYRFEIIVVVDGFADSTFSKAKKIEANNIRIYGYKQNQGKGYAVKYGILKTKDDVVGFIDAGGDIMASSIPKLIKIIEKVNMDIVIGSKLHPDSNIIYPFYRKLLFLGYRTLSRLLFGFDIRDTQVGLKFFKKKNARDIFKRITTKGFAFDIEVLAIATALGYKNIKEAPVKLNFVGNSSLKSTNLWKIIPRMVLDTFIVFYRLRIMKYYDRINKII